MIKRITIGLVLLFAVVIGVSAQGEEILDKIKKANESLTTITCDFKQTMHLTFMDEDVQSNGKFFYRKPDRLLLQYNQPEGDMMLIRGEQIFMHIMDQYTTTSTKTDPAIELLHSVFSSCLEGDPRNIKGSAVTATEKTSSYEISVSLKSDTMKGVTVHYDKQEMALTSLRTEDPEGGFTLYELTNKKLNQPIAEEVFRDPGK